MHIRTLLLLIVLGAIAAFTAVNWNAIMVPTNLSLLFTTIQAPLGLIMLGFTALLTSLFLLFIAYQQASLLMDTRRNTRELQAQRALADQAEVSRITGLHKFLEAEMLKLAEQAAESRAAVEKRLDQLERDLRSDVEQAGNTLAAYIGEFEDRLERGKTGTNSKPTA
jgi:uncharacterized integral membrane protein